MNQFTPNPKLKTRMSSSSKFPEQVIENILSRLPLKSLCRFKCVSKPWRSLISQPSFIKSQFCQNNLNKQALILSERTLFLLDLEDGSSSSHNVSAKKLLDIPHKFGGILGSCDGLVVFKELRSDDESFILLNPSTRCYKKIPAPTLVPGYEPYYRRYGFGYDSSSDDHKFVQITLYVKPGMSQEFPPNIVLKSINVYTVKSGTWSDSAMYQKPLVLLLNVSPGVFHNGVLYWISIRDKRYTLAAFDLQADKLEILGLPNAVASCDLFFYELVSFRGKFYMFNTEAINGPRDVWVMNEGGDSKSWSNFRFSVSGGDMVGVKSLFLMNDGWFLVILGDLRETKSVMSLYNSRGRMVRNVVGSWFRRFYGGNFSYMESLVSPWPASFLQSTSRSGSSSCDGGNLTTYKDDFIPLEVANLIEMLKHMSRSRES